MKRINGKKGMSLFYVITMMAVVMALSSIMLSVSLYNNSLAKLTEYKFESRISLDQIGEDFLGGRITSENFKEYDTTYEIIWFLKTVETVVETGIIVKKNNKVLFTVKKINDNITSWIYGEDKIDDNNYTNYCLHTCGYYRTLRWKFFKCINL